MVLVAVVTAVAIWLVPVDEDQPPPLPPPQPSAQDTSEALRLPSATLATEELALPAPPGGIGTVTTGGDRARTFIYELRAGGAQPDADVVFAEAQRMQEEGNLEDAYLLYRFAARNGQTQAALILGTQADPAFHAAQTSYLPDPDPGQAYKWYSVAATAGNETATQQLQALRKRVQRDAVAGDKQAQRLQLQWR